MPGTRDSSIALRLEILSTILELTKVYKRPPSRKELGICLNRHLTTIQQHLDILRAQGKVDWDDNVPHSLRITVPE